MSWSRNSFIIKNDGTLWGCGNNQYGELGLGDTSNRTTFTQIATNTNNIRSIYCGDNHTIILKNDGTLWGTGYNYYGVLGLGDTSTRYTFTQITTNVNDIKSVYCGSRQTFILKNDGTLWGTGYNGNGELGLGDTTHRTIFTKITTNADNIKSISCGYYHTCMLKNDGTLWGCGENSYGQLGLGKTTSTETIFTQITTKVNDVKSVHCGGRFTLMLKNDGTLWTCGHNGYGQLGLGDTSDRATFTQVTTNVDNIKSIYCGNYYCSFILKNDGTLWGCGHNSYGEFGLGDSSTRTTFTITSINTNGIKSIYCGYYHVSILKDNGTLWVCGYNGEGQLGLGDGKSRNVFTQVTTNVDNTKYLADDYDMHITKIYDLKAGYTETLDTNNFRNIPVNKFEKLKVLCANPDNTYLNCLISFDKKQTWKAFYGTTWTTISDISPENIILNGMQLKTLDKLDKDKLISGGFTGDLDFKIAMKTNDEKATSSVTKIYIEYK